MSTSWPARIVTKRFSFETHLLPATRQAVAVSASQENRSAVIPTIGRPSSFAINTGLRRCSPSPPQDTAINTSSGLTSVDWAINEP